MPESRAPHADVDVDRYDPLAGFDLVAHGGHMVFRVGEELLHAGGRAVEEAVEAGFPEGTELEYDGRAWAVVLPYDRGDEPGEPVVVVDLRPAPGYEWAEHDGRQVLRLGNDADPETRPALRPPGSQPGWRWRPAGELGWVLVPPPRGEPAPPAVPPTAPTVAPPAPPAPGIDVPAPAASPIDVPAPVAPPLEPTRPGPSRRGRLLDVLGIVLIALGLGLAAVLLLGRGGGNGTPADAGELAELLGIAPGDLLSAVTTHEPGELPTSIAPPTDPQARIAGSALVLIDVDADDAARLAGSVAGTPATGQLLVVLLELAGDAPTPGAGYRYALLDTDRSVVRVPEGDDGDGLARVDLRKGYFYDPALREVVTDRGELAAGAFATHHGRYVLIGVPRDELAGGTVFGHAAVRPPGNGPVGYMLSPAYQFG